jgi:uncharacterized protein YjcR
MSRLQEATQRLEAALMRLEKAAASYAESHDETAVREERDRLSVELAETQAENERLRDVNDTISGRLDSAISRLKSVLEV